MCSPKILAISALGGQCVSVSDWQWSCHKNPADCQWKAVISASCIPRILDSLSPYLQDKPECQSAMFTNRNRQLYKVCNNGDYY